MATAGASLSVLEQVFIFAATFGGGLFFVRVLLMGLGGGLPGSEGIDALDAAEGLDAAHALEATHGLDALDGVDVVDAMDSVQAHQPEEEARRRRRAALREAAGKQMVPYQGIVFRPLSLLGVTGFSMNFGLFGLGILWETPLGAPGAIAGSMVAGFGTLWILKQLFGLTRYFHSSGTVRTLQAIGAAGTVYLSIPEGGSGQVQIVVQERLRVYDAVSDDDEPIPFGEKIRVIDLEENDVLVVTRDV